MSMLGTVVFISGGLVPLFFKKISSLVLSVILGFTGGIMLYGAFIKFIPASFSSLNEFYGTHNGTLITNICFFSGLLFTMPIDLLASYKQRKYHEEYEPLKNAEKHEYSLFMLIFLSITIHAFVEGIATYLTYLSETKIALPIIISLIAHNFPEGALITMVFMKMFKKKKKAFYYCLIASFAMPLGAIITFFIFKDFSSPSIFGVVKGILAGLLVNTALDEMLPGAELKGNHKLSTNSLILGMVFMAIIIQLGLK